MSKIYVIIYENSKSEENKKPVRGIVNYAFTDWTEAALQAAKADKKFDGIKHKVEELPVIEG